MAAPEYRALQQEVGELQRLLLGEKTLENEILRQVLDLAQQKKNDCRARFAKGTYRGRPLTWWSSRPEAWLSDGLKAAEFGFVASPLLPHLGWLSGIQL